MFIYISIWCVFFSIGSFCERLLLVHSTQSEREGEQCGLPGTVIKGRLCLNVEWQIIWQKTELLSRMIAPNVVSNVRHQVAPVIKERMMKRGTMMVGYQPMDGHVNFFRMVIVSPQLTTKDMDFFLDEIEELGKDLVWISMVYQLSMSHYPPSFCHF